MQSNIYFCKTCRNEMAAHLPDSSSGSSATSFPLSYPRLSTMSANTQKQKRRETAISLLDAAIEALNLAKEVSSATPAKAVFGSVGILLTMIKVSFVLFSSGSSQVHMYTGLDGQ